MGQLQSETSETENNSINRRRCCVEHIFHSIWFTYIFCMRPESQEVDIVIPVFMHFFSLPQKEKSREPTLFFLSHYLTILRKKKFKTFFLRLFLSKSLKKNQRSWHSNYRSFNRIVKSRLRQGNKMSFFLLSFLLIKHQQNSS